MFTLTLLSACSTTPVPVVGASSEPAAPQVLAAAHVPVITHEYLDGMGDEPEAWIFGREFVHTIDIELSDAAYNSLDEHPFDYVDGNFILDDVRVDEVGVRLRGAIGSFREIWDKPKFKIEFDFVHDGRKFYGLEELALNNSVADCSFLKEAVAYKIYELAGLATPRLAFARLRLNGIDYGFYQIVESEDENWLQRNFSDPSGNMYDGKYIWYGGWSYTLLDFDAAVQDLYKLEEGVDVAHADVHAVTEALAASQYTPQFMAVTGEVVDWAQWHAMLAAEEVAGHNDGYALNQNNNRIWFDPADGKVEIYPWDLDNTFLIDSYWGMNWALPRGKLAATCWADATCATDQAATVEDLLDTVAGFDWNAYIDELDALTYADAVADPKLSWCAASVAPARQDLRDWFVEHPPIVRAHWGL